MDFPGENNLKYITITWQGVQRAPLSPPQELEVGGHRPLYLLVVNTKGNKIISVEYMRFTKTIVIL